MPKARKLALALSGGNALGAFQAGALAHFIRTGLEADFVAGTSIGAINAALLLGARDRDPEGSLRRFWQELAIDILALSREQQDRMGGVELPDFRPSDSLAQPYRLTAGRAAHPERTSGSRPVGAHARAPHRFRQAFALENASRRMRDRTRA
ncbi:MAG: patatin-like phospholipase family protein [Hyphomicrobiales bacterium]|nr:patatin-like phospholipase family protein [Hyphomicrobiales bacterium]